MKRCIVVFLLLCSMSFLSFAEEKVVLYPNINGLGEKAFGYQILDFALKKTGKP